MSSSRMDRENIQHRISNPMNKETSKIEHRTSNIEPITARPTRNRPSELKTEFSISKIDCLITRPRSSAWLRNFQRRGAGNHVASQLLRSGTSPLPNHGEAESAESPADFVHKLKVCLKELCETKRWLRLVVRVPMLSSNVVNPLLQETIELIRIFL